MKTPLSKKLNCIFAIIFLFLQVGCSKNISGNLQSYKIAVVAPQSGPYSILGREIINGAELAVHEVNNSGGINGKKIVLVKEDDGGLVGEGAFFAYRLTRTEKILGVIGHLNSDISIPASEFYTKAMIVQISPGSTSPYFTEREATRGYVFRTIGRDDTQGKLLAEYVIKNGKKKVAVLYNNREYGKILSGEFVKSLKVATVPPQVVFYEMIEVGKKDYGSLLARISSLSPDVIFLAGEHDEAANLVKDFDKYGLGMTLFIGGDGIDNNEFVQAAGKNSEGAVVISSAADLDNSFIEKYKNQFGAAPSGYAGNSYDAANILISAITKVKDLDPEKIATEVAMTKGFKGVTGEISFNENGDLTRPGFVLSRVENGAFKRVADSG